MRRRSPRPQVVVDDQYLASLRDILEPFGIEHVGVTSAEVLWRARHEIERRKALGLHDGMGFTYRNPTRSTDPTQAVKSAKTVIVAARPYASDEPPRPAEPSGRVARYAWADHYEPLRTGLRRVAKRLRDDGYKAVAFADDNSMVDREVAYQAGLGWFGKNANLLVTGRGSWFVLGSVVTTAPLPVAASPVADGCGTCRRCIDACPTGAIIADGVIDAARCLAWVVQKPGTIAPDMRAAIGDRLYGCDDCQTSCPPTVRLGVRSQPSVTDEPRAWLPMLDWLAMDDDQLVNEWGSWYLADRDPRWIRRNVAIVLGNAAPPDDERVVAALHTLMSGDDPIVAEHAAWAMARLAERRGQVSGAPNSLR